jgi:hypothetical protein
VEAPLDVSVPETAPAAQALGWHELQVVAARLIGSLRTTLNTPARSRTSFRR